MSIFMAFCNELVAKLALDKGTGCRWESPSCAGRLCIGSIERAAIQRCRFSFLKTAVLLPSPKTLLLLYNDE